MREQNTDLADVADAVKQISEATTLPAPKLKESANRGLETAGTSVEGSESTGRPVEEIKQVVGDFKGSNGNGGDGVNGSPARSGRQVTGLSAVGDMARAVAVNVAVVEATDVEVNETVDGVDSSAAATDALVMSESAVAVNEREGMPSYQVSDEHLAAMKRMKEMVTALKMKKHGMSEAVVENAQPVRQKTHFERMSEWIKSGDNVLKNEVVK